MGLTCIPPAVVTLSCRETWRAASQTLARGWASRCRCTCARVDRTNGASCRGPSLPPPVAHTQEGTGRVGRLSPPSSPCSALSSPAYWQALLDDVPSTAQGGDNQHGDSRSTPHNTPPCPPQVGPDGSRGFAAAVPARCASFRCAPCESSSSSRSMDPSSRQGNCRTSRCRAPCPFPTTRYSQLFAPATDCSVDQVSTLAYTRWEDHRCRCGGANGFFERPVCSRKRILPAFVISNQERRPLGVLRVVLAAQRKVVWSPLVEGAGKVWFRHRGSRHQPTVLNTAQQDVQHLLHLWDSRWPLACHAGCGGTANARFGDKVEERADRCATACLDAFEHCDECQASHTTAVQHQDTKRLVWVPHGIARTGRQGEIGPTHEHLALREPISANEVRCFESPASLVFDARYKALEESCDCSTDPSPSPRESVEANITSVLTCAVTLRTCAVKKSEAPDQELTA
eukprot:7384069-Prymnesium_polylepis.1